SPWGRHPRSQGLGGTLAPPIAPRSRRQSCPPPGGVDPARQGPENQTARALSHAGGVFSNPSRPYSLWEDGQTRCTHRQRFGRIPVQPISEPFQTNGTILDTPRL